jgi:hypothetical protein
LEAIVTDMQTLINVLSDGWRRDRQKYHLCLGDLITALEAVPEAWPVQLDRDPEHSLGDVDSYRGYYSDLAFEVGPPRSAGEVLAQAREALGATFEGYKGGDFVMGPDTPLWLSSYGTSSGVAITAAEAVGNAVIIRTRQLD